MNRREFIGTATAAALLRRFSYTFSKPASPISLDLRVPMRAAAECATRRMDATRNYRPWFGVQIENGLPSQLVHENWDLGDTSGRFLEAFVMARQMFSPPPFMRLAERRIRAFLHSLFKNGVIYGEDTAGPDHMFAQGSALYALVSDYEASPDSGLRARIESFILALEKLAAKEEDYSWYPQVATKLAPCSHMGAYQIFPMVRFYELTRFAPALRFSERLSRWVLFHDPTITPAGVITKTAWEGHLHAWMDTFTGIIRCAAAGADLDHEAICRRAERLYLWVREHWTTDFGWVADSVGSQTCETDTITSFIRLALELIRIGRHEYWNDIERAVRNQLVENQFRNVDRLHIADTTVRKGVSGAFESYAKPNTLLALQKGTLEGCCIHGGMRGLFVAFQNAVTVSGDAIRVNLLLSNTRPQLDVVSFLPHQGRLELHTQSQQPIWVRCPDWLKPDKAKVDGPGSLKVENKSKGPYLKLSGLTPGAKLSIDFDLPEKEKSYTVAGNLYKAKWCGDTVLELSPCGEPYPIYLRRR